MMHPDQIAARLAGCDPIVESALGGGVGCALCGHDILDGLTHLNAHDPDSHDERCPWAAARRIYVVRPDS